LPTELIQVSTFLSTGFVKSKRGGESSIYGAQHFAKRAFQALLLAARALIRAELGEDESDEMLLRHSGQGLAGWLQVEIHGASEQHEEKFIPRKPVIFHES
jgi:hypothetical protein